MDQLLMLFALHAGAVNTFGLDGDNLPSETTPGVELEAQLQPIPWISIGPIAKYVHYTQRGADADEDNVKFTDANTLLSVGGRLYVRPIPQLFAGVGFSVLWDRDDFAERGKTKISSQDALNPDITVGGNVARIGDYRFQLMGSFDWASVGISLYQMSISIGVERIFHGGAVVHP